MMLNAKVLETGGVSLPWTVLTGVSSVLKFDIIDTYRGVSKTLPSSIYQLFIMYNDSVLGERRLKLCSHEISSLWFCSGSTPHSVWEFGQLDFAGEGAIQL